MKTETIEEILKGLKVEGHHDFSTDDIVQIRREMQFINKYSTKKFYSKQIKTDKGDVLRVFRTI